MLNSETTFCPALRRSIDPAYCMELQMSEENDITLLSADDHFTNEQSMICAGCAYRNNPFKDD